LYGYDADELVERGLFYPVHTEDAARVEREVRSDIDNRNTEGAHEFRVHTRSGELKWVESRARYLYDHAGNLEQVVPTIRDIAEKMNRPGFSGDCPA
jgi:PAS domain S-box-containing protein